MRQVYTDFKEHVAIQCSHEAVLLITQPGLKFWHRKAQIEISKATLIDIDPDFDDAHRLREYARNTPSKKGGPRISYEDSFDWEREKFVWKSHRSLRNYDEELRIQSISKICAFVSLVVTEMNLSKL